MFSVDDAEELLSSEIDRLIMAHDMASQQLKDAQKRLFRMMLLRRISELTKSESPISVKELQDIQMEISRCVQQKAEAIRRQHELTAYLDQLHSNTEERSAIRAITQEIEKLGGTE